MHIDNVGDPTITSSPLEVFSVTERYIKYLSRDRRSFITITRDELAAALDAVRAQSKADPKYWSNGLAGLNVPSGDSLVKELSQAFEPAEPLDRRTFETQADAEESLYEAWRAGDKQAQ